MYSCVCVWNQCIKGSFGKWSKLFMALNKTVSPQKSNSSFCWQKYYKSFPCLSVPCLFHAWIIMFAVLIDLPFGHPYQVGLKLMALIYHYPGLITYPVTLDAQKSLLRIWKRKAEGNDLEMPVKGSKSCWRVALCGRVISIWLLVDTATDLPPAILPIHSCHSCSVSSHQLPVPHSQMWN